MKHQPKDKLADSFAISAVVRLTVKGVEIELTHDEAKALCAALSAITGAKIDDDKMEQIKRSIERINDRTIPTPYIPSIPRRPRDDRDDYPWRAPWREIWCSADKSMRAAISQPHTNPHAESADAQE